MKQDKSLLYQSARAKQVFLLASASGICWKFLNQHNNLMKKAVDIIIVGAGHNGLVSAILLARAGLKVIVLEEKDTVGGAAKTEFPFTKVPTLGTSTGAYLLGIMSPELIRTLGVEFPLLRRDPHYFLPTTGKRYLLFGSDHDAMQNQFIFFF